MDAQEKKQEGQKPAMPQTTPSGPDFRRSLSKLKDRARELVDRQIEDDRQERADLERIRKRIEDQSADDWEDVSRRMSALKSDTVDNLKASRKAVRDRLARLKARMSERKQDMDQQDAETRAAFAEEYAFEVMAFASDALNEAELAAVDAVAARKDADELKAKRPTTPVH